MSARRTRVQFGKLPITVEVAPKLGELGAMHGCWVAEDLTVYLDAAEFADQDQTRETLIHEFIHVAETFRGVQISHDDVHRLASALAELLKPWFKNIKI
jgi:hypothetical protein